MIIILDAMGGDNAPLEVIKGAAMAARNRRQAAACRPDRRDKTMRRRKRDSA